MKSIKMALLGGAALAVTAAAAQADDLEALKAQIEDPQQPASPPWKPLRRFPPATSC